MNPARPTWVLAAAVLILSAVDGLAHRAATPPPPMPTLAAVLPAAVHSVTLTHLDEHVALARSGADWLMTAPRSQSADRRSVEAVLDAFDEAIVFDARVDVSPEEEKPYGLAPEDLIVLTLKGADGADLLRLMVGNNLGDSTFVRLPDDGNVYRARIGGRGRFDRPVGAWRDHRVFAYSVPPASLSVTTDAHALVFTRSASSWTSPSLQVDTPLVETVAQALGAFESGEELRADDVRANGARLVDVDIRLGDGRSALLHFTRAAGATAVRVAGSTEVHLVGPYLADVLAAPAWAWRNHALLERPPQQIARHVLDEGGAEVVLEPVGDAWSVTRPANVSVDSEVAGRVAVALGQLRVEQWIEIDAALAGFPSETRIRVEGKDGVIDVIEVGGFGPKLPGDRPTRFVRVVGNPNAIGLLSAKGWQTVRSAFGR